MKAGYRGWLEAQKYDAGTINAQMYRASRVEEHPGNLDEHYANDRLASLARRSRTRVEPTRAQYVTSISSSEPFSHALQSEPPQW